MAETGLTDAGDPWAELRAFANERPSPLAFRALVSVLDTWPGDDRAAAITHAEQLLEGWSDEDRVAPWSWCKAAAQGQVEPTWRLVRSLELTTRHLTKGKVDLARLTDRADLRGITVLRLPLFSGAAALQHRADRFPNLHTLQATDGFRAEVRALDQSKLWDRIETFESFPADASLTQSEATRLQPDLGPTNPIRHLTMTGLDLIDLWDRTSLPSLASTTVFIQSPEEAESFAARPELRRLGSLALAFRCGFAGNTPFDPWLGTVIDDDEVAANAFFDRADLGALRSLTVAGRPMGYWGREGLGPDGLRSLLASGLLQQLEHLRLVALPLGDAGVAELAPNLGPGLTALELEDLYCKGAGAAALSRSPCLPSLHTLSLAENRCDADGVSQLAAAPMPALRHLDLGGRSIDPNYSAVIAQPVLDEGVAAWADGPNLDRLVSLNLRNCHLTDRSLEALSTARLADLRDLDLSHNSFTAAGFATTVDAPLWSSIERLSLKHTRLDDDAIGGLTTVGPAPRLRELQLSYNSIGPDGAAALAAWPELGRLWRLDLHDNVIGDDGLVALARSPHGGRLVELILEQDSSNSQRFDYADETATTLAASTSLRRLDALFTGTIDGYHGDAYSPGFTKTSLRRLVRVDWLRPSLRASLADHAGIEPYLAPLPFDRAGEADGRRDFRRNDAYTLNTSEATEESGAAKQLGRAAEPTVPFRDLEPPTISDPPEIAPVDDREITRLEGLEHRSPKPRLTDRHQLTVPNEGWSRSANGSSVLAGTLQSILHAEGAGDLSYQGGSSRDGVVIENSYTFGWAKAEEPAMTLLLQTLWWLDAPWTITLERERRDPSTRRITYEPSDSGFALTQPPADATTRFVQFVNPWLAPQADRLRRVPFSDDQRAVFAGHLASGWATANGLALEAADPDESWVEVRFPDGGAGRVHQEFLGSPECDTLNVVIEQLSVDLSRWIHSVMAEGELLLLPMSLTASARLTGALADLWATDVAESPGDLHDILATGPFARARANRS